MPDLFCQKSDRDGGHCLGKRRQTQNDPQKVRGQPERKNVKIKIGLENSKAEVGKEDRDQVDLDVPVQPLNFFNESG